MVKGVFVGSGSEGMQSPEVVQACLSLTSSSTPTVLYIGTATYDLPVPFDRQTKTFASQGCRITQLKCTEDGDCTLIETKYLVEESLTARATCRNCGIKIDKAALRVAFPGVIPRPDWGAGNFYLHASCAHALGQLSKQEIEKCYGYNSLTKKQQDEVRRGFKKPTATEDALALAKVDDKGAP